MSPTRILTSTFMVSCFLLQACVTSQANDASTADPAAAPELTLNLSGSRDNCVAQAVYDFTPLERGFTALAAGEHVEAVQHFQRYQRFEKTPAAELEASIGIAYVSILPASPLYNTDEARKSYRKLRQVPRDDMELHEQTLLMLQSLETFLMMERKINDLTEDNKELAKNLQKREDALKRLRELTLGQ